MLASCLVAIRVRENVTQLRGRVPTRFSIYLLTRVHRGASQKDHAELNGLSNATPPTQKG